MGLRAPRVAYVVPCGQDWHFNTRVALSEFSRLWGGARFVVVPVSSGTVHPALVAALRAYDPDHVVVPAATSPIAVAGTDRPGLHAAQEIISAACSNYRSPIAAGASVAAPRTGQVEPTYLTEQSMMPLTAIDSLTERVSSDRPVGANPQLGGALGVAAATTWGLAELPADSHTGVDQTLLRSAIRRWVRGDFGEPLAGVTTTDTADGQFRTEFDRTRFGLTNACEIGLTQPPALIVWGDSPADFALAMAWDRTYENGIWVPDAWWRDPQARRALTDALSLRTGAGLRDEGEIVITSTSLDESALKERLEGCRADSIRHFGHQLEGVTAIPADKLEFPRSFKWHLAIKGKLHSEWSTTVLQDPDGTVVFAMLPPTPLVGIPGFEKIENNAHWHVDISIRDRDIPNTTAVPDGDLLAGGTDEAFDVRIRSSRSGITFASHRTGLVFNNTSVEQKLSRPFVRVPSLAAWAQSRAAIHDMSTQLSAAGAQAELLAKLLSGRAELAEIVSGHMLPAFQAFNARGTTRGSFPDGEGCVVRDQSFLTFAGICSRAAMEPNSNARDKIDELLQSRLLHRGLITRCSECKQLSFVPVEDVATHIRCQRCLTTTQLSRESWRLPLEEPRWFYHLHPTARELLNQNGHVPLQLSRYLRGSARRYTDAPEFELVTVAGQREVETDLLALADRQVVAAEAKITDTFGTGRGRETAAKKRVLAAKVLCADQMILATSRDSWNSGTVGAMVAAIREEQWPSGTPPRLRIICGLGTSNITDDYA
jgi:hypothetical protein